MRKNDLNQIDDPVVMPNNRMCVNPDWKIFVMIVILIRMQSKRENDIDGLIFDAPGCPYLYAVVVVVHTVETLTVIFGD